MGPCWGCVLTSPIPRARLTFLVGHCPHNCPPPTVSHLPSYRTCVPLAPNPLPTQPIWESWAETGGKHNPCPLCALECSLGTSWARRDEGLSLAGLTPGRVSGCSRIGCLGSSCWAARCQNPHLPAQVQSGGQGCRVLQQTGSSWLSPSSSCVGTTTPKDTPCPLSPHRASTAQARPHSPLTAPVLCEHTSLSPPHRPPHPPWARRQSLPTGTGVPRTCPPNQARPSSVLCQLLVDHPQSAAHRPPAPPRTHPAPGAPRG